MQNCSRLPVAISLILCLSGAMLISACSDSEPRAQSQHIMRELDKAQRLHGRALEMLGNVVIRINDEVTPIHKSIGNDARISFEQDLNPQAIIAIDKARKILDDALKASPKAADTTRALAQSMLAKVLVLKADCDTFRAGRIRAKATAATREAHAAMSVLRDQANLLALLDKFAAMSNADMQKIIAESGQAVASLQKRIATKQRDVIKKKADRDRLEKQAAALSGKAGGFRQQSDLAKGQKSLELFGRSQDYERQAAKKLFEIERIEQNISAIRLTVNELQTEMNSTQRRQTTAVTILAERGVLVAASGGKTKEKAEAIQAAQAARKAAAVQTLASAEAETLTQLKATAEACEKLAVADKAALDNYDAAANLLKKAGVTDRKTATYVAEQAATLMRAAAVESNSLLVKEANGMLAESASRLWSDLDRAEPPAELATIKQYAPDPDAIRKSAAKRYKQAADLYDNATRRVVRRDRWTYQTQAAKAYYLVAKLDKDSDALGKAKTAIAAALDGKRNSPYLKNAVRLESLINSVQ